MRYRALAPLWRWLTEEGEVRDNPFSRMKPPTVPETPVPVITDDQLRKLLATGDGPGFEERRDSALVRLLLDSGVRCSELMNLTVEEVDQDAQVIYVVGKGRRPRAVPYGKKTAQVVDRYLRVRARHAQAGLSALWIGPKGRLGDSGLRHMLERQRAGGDRTSLPAPVPPHHGSQVDG